MKPIHLVYVLTRLCAKNLFQILSPNPSECTFWLSLKQCRSRSASFFRSLLIRIYTVFQAVYAMLHNLERANCIHLLKIESDGNFNLLFGKTTSI